MRQTANESISSKPILYDCPLEDALRRDIALRHHLSLPSDLTEVPRKSLSRVFLTGAADEAFLLKARCSDLSGEHTSPFLREARILELLPPFGMPSPRPLAAGTLDVLDENCRVVSYEYLAQQRLPGAVEAEFEGTNDSAVFQLGVALAELHRLPMRDNALLRYTKDAAYGSWRDFITNEYSWRMLESTRMKERLSVATCTRIETALERLSRADERVMIHGDTNPAHVLVDANGSATGLIDWETCMYAPRTCELAAFYFTRIVKEGRSEREFDALISGYGGSFSPTEQNLFQDSLVLHSLKTVHWWGVIMKHSDSVRDFVLRKTGRDEEKAYSNSLIFLKDTSLENPLQLYI